MSMEARATRRNATKRNNSEHRIQKQCERWLIALGALVNRSNAGAWTIDGRYVRGAVRGTGDLTCCLPGGRYLEAEIKRPGGQQSDAQRDRQARVVACGGLYVLADSLDTLRAGLGDALGADTVAAWERAAAERAAADRQQRREQRQRRRPEPRRPAQAWDVSAADDLWGDS